MSRFDNTSFKNPHFKNLAAFKDEYQRSISDPKYFLNKAKQELSWFHEPTRSNEGTFTAPKWFSDGKINISYNDDFLIQNKSKNNIIYKDFYKNRANIEFIEKKYKKDLEFFNYTFKDIN